MKVLLGVLILVLAVSRVTASIETCTEITDCSETMKNKCTEISESLDGGQKSILRCLNGICMCNLEFPRHTPSASKHIDESCAKEMEKEQETATEATTTVAAEAASDS